MSVSVILGQLQGIMDQYGEGTMLKAYKISSIITVSVVVTTFLGGILGTAGESGNSIGLASGYYSATCAQFFFITQKVPAKKAIEEIKAVAFDLERSASCTCSETADDFLNTSAKCRRTLRIFKFYMFSAMTSVVVSPILLGKPVGLWPQPTTTVELGVVFAAQLFTGLSSTMAFLSFVPWLYSLSALNACLFRALGRYVQSSKGKETMLNAIRMHQSLTNGAHRMDAILSRWMIHIMAVLMIPPLLTIHDLTSGKGVGLSLAACPLLVVAFIPWCFVGQELQDASDDISFRAYCGNWIDDDFKTRRPRILLMMRANKPCLMSVYGLGMINLPTCRAVLKTWFSYLQLLLKV